MQIWSKTKLNKKLRIYIGIIIIKCLLIIFNIMNLFYKCKENCSILTTLLLLLPFIPQIITIINLVIIQKIIIKQKFGNFVEIWKDGYYFV